MGEREKGRETLRDREERDGEGEVVLNATVEKQLGARCGNNA